MKKKIILLVALTTLLCGCGKTIPKLENGEEAVVTFEDGSMISVDDLYEEMRDSYATSVLIKMIDEKLLNEAYKDKVEEVEKFADAQVEAIKLSYKDDKGNYDEAKFTNALQNAGYASTEEFKKSIVLDKLSEYAVKDYVKETIKDKDIEKYYKDEVKPDREVSHILITSGATSSMSETEKKEKEDEVLNEAKAVIAKLKKGEKFEDLAKDYSDDAATKEEGGSLGIMNKDSYGSDAFDKEMYSLKVGSYSTTPVKTTSGYEILYIKEEKEKESLEDSREKIIDKMVEEKLEKDSSLNITGLVEFRKAHGVNIVDTEVNKSYNRYMDNLIASEKSNN